LPHREGRRRLRQALGVVDGEPEPGPGEPLAGPGHHRLGEVDAEGVPFGEPFGQCRRRQPRPAGDVEAVPVGLGGEEVQPPAGEVGQPLGEQLVVGDGDAAPGVAHPGLLGRLVIALDRAGCDRLSRHRHLPSTVSVRW
jgi:hypothetical protein